MSLDKLYSGAYAGAYVIKPNPGSYSKVITMNFASLYPGLGDYKDRLARMEIAKKVKEEGKYHATICEFSHFGPNG